MLKSKVSERVQEVILPDFPDDDNTVTTVTKSRRVSFGTNFVKEFIVGSAVSGQCLPEYEQAFPSSDSSNTDSSHSGAESGILGRSGIFSAPHETHKVHKPVPPVGQPAESEFGESRPKLSRFSSTVCFSADSPTADVEFTEGCLSLAKSILEKKNKEMTVFIQAKSKDDEKGKEEETKYFDGSQLEMSMTRRFKPKAANKREEKFEGEKTKIFGKFEDEMSVTRCNRIFNEDEMSLTRCRKIFNNEEEGDEDWEDSKENRMPLDMMIRLLDKDSSDMEKDLFYPEKTLGIFLNADPFDLSNESEKLNMNESIDVSVSFQSNMFKGSSEIPPSPMNQIRKSTVEQSLNRTDLVLAPEAAAFVHKSPERMSLDGSNMVLASEEAATVDKSPERMSLDGSNMVLASEEAATVDKLPERMSLDESNMVLVSEATPAVDKLPERMSLDGSKDCLLSETTPRLPEEPQQTNDKVDPTPTDHEVSKLGGKSLDEIDVKVDLSPTKQEMNKLGGKSLDEVDDKVDPTPTEQEKNKLGGKSLDEIDDKVDPTPTEQEKNKLAGRSLDEIDDKVDPTPTEQEKNKLAGRSLNEIDDKVDPTPTEQEKNKLAGRSLDEVDDNEDPTLTDQEMNKLAGKSLDEVDDKVDPTPTDHEVNKLARKSLDEVDDKVDPTPTDHEVNKLARKSLDKAEDETTNELEPSLLDLKVVESLKEQSKEPNCVWTLKHFRHPRKKVQGSLSFNCRLLESSTVIHFGLKISNEDGLDACSNVTNCELSLNEENRPKLPEYLLVVDFGYEELKKCFDERRIKVENIRHVPYFMDLINSFMLKTNAYLGQIYSILTSYPGSRLEGPVLSFRLYSFPVFFSCTVSIDLSNLYRLSKSSLSFEYDFGSLDENKIREIFQNCLRCDNSLCEFVVQSTKYLIELEKKSGYISKRQHIRLLPAELKL